jgi:AcrR family transcriptional regulator
VGHVTATTAGRVRLSPHLRREQLLELGVRLFSTHPIDQLSIDMLAEEAGISRGLLYHYFDNLRDFHRAVVRKAADDLIAVTAPPAEGEPLDRLARSLEAYVDYVTANLAGYTSLVRAAAGGDEALREIYEEARAALTDRIFRVTEQVEPSAFEDTLGVEDTPANRLMVRGWAAMTEDVVLAWVRDPRGISKADLLAMLAAALPGVLSDR